MRFVVLCYYHALFGPSLIQSIPEGLDPEITNDLCRTLDFLEDPGFFVQYKNNYKIVNWYFEIPNELARGGKDMLLASIVLIEDNIDPMILKDSMKHFVDKLKALDGLSWSLYLKKTDTGSKEETKRIQAIQNEIKNILKEFKDSLPEFPPVIRMMRAEDLERIIEIDHQLLGEKRPDFWKRKLDMIEKNSVLPPLVAETGNKVIGFILGQASSWEYIVPENIGWIDTLGVDLAYQRKGVARSLMGELLNRMKKFGVNTVYTLVNWRDGSLLQFFNRMGFERGGIINLELKIDIEKSDFATIQRSYNNRESLRKEK